MTSFELEVWDVHDPVCRHVSVTGELDLTNAGDLEKAILEAARDGRPVALDLTGVSLVDSAALHALFRSSRHLGRQGFGLVLPAGSPLTRTFEIVGLPKLVPVGTSVAELLAALDATG